MFKNSWMRLTMLPWMRFLLLFPVFPLMLTVDGDGGGDPNDPNDPNDQGDPVEPTIQDVLAENALLKKRLGQQGNQIGELRAFVDDLAKKNRPSSNGANNNGNDDFTFDENTDLYDPKTFVDVQSRLFDAAFTKRLPDIISAVDNRLQSRGIVNDSEKAVMIEINDLRSKGVDDADIQKASELSTIMGWTTIAEGYAELAERGLVEKIDFGKPNKQSNQNNNNGQNFQQKQNKPGGNPRGGEDPGSNNGNVSKAKALEIIALPPSEYTARGYKFSDLEMYERIADGR